MHSNPNAIPLSLSLSHCMSLFFSPFLSLSVCQSLSISVLLSIYITLALTLFFSLSLTHTLSLILSPPFVYRWSMATTNQSEATFSWKNFRAIKSDSKLKQFLWAAKQFFMTEADSFNILSSSFGKNELRKCLWWFDAALCNKKIYTFHVFPSNGSGCSTVAEHAPQEQVVVVSNPALCAAGYFKMCQPRPTVHTFSSSH